MYVSIYSEEFHTGKWIVTFINSRLFYVIESYNCFSNYSTIGRTLFIAYFKSKKSIVFSTL